MNAALELSRNTNGSFELSKKLKKLGMKFCVPISSQFEKENHIAKPEKLLTLIEDPVAVFASHYGVSEADYLACCLV